ncbi:MAG: bifunctional diaminohydroxyphosphoribosylaminopyrimidine deaminase/5-amino-6-(5-phosphoribosylamino)uracil reductase RibD, partial [Proteobacteria bacterium]|nr:bifunctional diaminohydroxyphosphoribosylaminopyrimidine deaminase/5-amino-6-(5-phosphoribosylamino)uracil reductase RibD [Pseudomonadota bacterium]
MRLALELARRGYGRTSPNPMVGAVLVRGRRELGRGWHRGAGLAHAEIEALRDAGRRGHSPRGSTLYVTLEPCSTQGRTPPCTGALLVAGIGRVVVGTTDPNPAHHGRGLRQLRRAGVEVSLGPLTEDCVRLNEAFNHW